MRTTHNLGLQVQVLVFQKPLCVEPNIKKLGFICPVPFHTETHWKESVADHHCLLANSGGRALPTPPASCPKTLCPTMREN